MNPPKLLTEKAFDKAIADHVEQHYRWTPDSYRCRKCDSEIKQVTGYNGSGIGEGTGGSDGRRGLGFKHRDIITNGRNKRSVWTINSSPCPEAHFATFPQKLIEPCILAGSRLGDLVLDPFGGIGTTSLVCNRLGRRSVCLELSPDYIEIAKRRTAQLGLGI